ncbi:GNAT family N-acetyltransferase [Clostridium sp. JS66]|uniref:GNAT family N-acetyltransferase n=1 Tax=Clostridium sp. JS66 TaxID=3064705 RepID=UPI00298D79E2|nr:GNAT family N-acetyltransferase [Clostridium sp. JS66]WPC43366.1 GNAT family N-acetyltransferase [Clostridium sp. JS66]
MKILNVEDRNEMLIDKLCKVWVKSVRATHLFLSDSEIKEIAKYIPRALKQIPHLVIATNNENEPVAFMGIEGEKLEMLFISPEERGKGLGKQLIGYGIKHHSVNELGVNEQNPQAKGFYEHMGFQVYKRTDIDEQGNPYPILYMKLP